MGKSPGRWIKTLLFGKKTSRSKHHKPDDKKTEVKEVPVSQDQRTELNTEENQQPDNSQEDACYGLNAQSDSDKIIAEQAAIHLQAAFRGYLARSTFRTLIGIIRLQALIRGHLVRRQAISTLYCMLQIVKFQAVVRGRKVRNSSIGIQVLSSVGIITSTQILKQSSNGFARKILASSPTPMPLHFQYDSNEANSVLSWLERWSTSRFWQHLPNPKSSQPSESQKPHTRRSSVDNIGSEFNKPVQRNLKKVSSDEHVNGYEERPELVLQRVKSNLRKVTVNNPVLQSTDYSVQRIITEPERVSLSESEKEDENGAVCEPVKQVFMEKKEPTLQIKQRLVPSYMAATVSAKAKLRGQDGPENSNALSLTRRHSLPSSSNVKVPVSSMVKSAGKLKNDRSLQLSRDGNVLVKVNHTEWRR